ncbi:MAG: DUF2188 domain-containing protein [Spirochaetaceae bacterium]|nr:DUF2188 domain-containing protein [Spirochaetaceae bacterium]
MRYVKDPNVQRASIYSANKAETISIARTICQNQRSKLFIHNMNGQIASCDSYGNDPFPPRG